MKVIPQYKVTCPNNNVRIIKVIKDGVKVALGNRGMKEWRALVHM